MLVTALTSTYNLDVAFAGTLAASINQVTHTGGDADTIALSDLSQHGAIEHDASLTRNDAITGDNHSVQPALVQALLDDAKGAFLTVESVGSSRKRREKESLGAGSPPLDAKAATLAGGEAALLLQVLGHLGPNGGKGEYAVPKEAARQWLLEEKLPDNWKLPPYMITFVSTTALSAKVVAAKNMGGLGGVEGVEGLGLLQGN